MPDVHCFIGIWMLNSPMITQGAYSTYKGFHNHHGLRQTPWAKVNMTSFILTC